jgi:hypothetical protein
MSVLKLRRDMVVVEDEPEAKSAPESEKPFPLRPTPQPDEDIIEGEIAIDDEEGEEAELPHRKTVFQQVRFWFNAAAIVAALGAYPAFVIASSDVGDRDFDRVVNRADWAAPWAGGFASLMEQHFDQLGWASDADVWEPMARLTAKPAYQSAMAASLGDIITLAQAQAVTDGAVDPDLEAAARLVSGDSTAIQLRAARDALVNFDRRMRRRDEAAAFTPTQITEQLSLVSAWAAASHTQVSTTTSAIGVSPMDEEATRAVYAAKGRAAVAYVVLASMQWPESVEAAKARNAAMSAWQEVAEFHPLIVLNGDADGSVFGNHPAAIGFLVARAEAATQTFAKLVASAVPATPSPAPAAGPAAASGSAP